MLDTVTLRVVFVFLTAIALALFYFATYRPTRSAYSRWWCLALLSFGVSSGLFLFNGTAAQLIANPLGNTFGVVGTVLVWCSSRSLLGLRAPRWALLALPSLALVVALLDDPAHDVWTGGALYLAAMTFGFGAAGVDLVRLLTRARSGEDPAGEDPQYRTGLVAMTAGLSLVAVFYLARTVVFVLAGPDTALFERALGGQVTTILVTIMLAIAMFTMSALSRAQYTADLLVRATHDGLTGLLNRSEFIRQARRTMERDRLGAPAVLAVADVDRFKQLNDLQGHAAGDRVLAAVGASCRRHLLPGEIAGRIGGDEFALLITHAERMRSVADEMNRELAGVTTPAVTVSFGLADLWADDDLDAVMERADRALYAAKAAGGSRVLGLDPRE